jgi:uncharacterized phage protein (TIGR01671 family)
VRRVDVTGLRERLRRIRMQREISFRGQRVDTKEWVYGYLFKIWERTYILWGTTNDIPNMIEVIPETVGQYTGLKDKDGNKIFEGDIVRCVDKISGYEFTALVEFGNPNNKYNWGYQLRHISGDKPNLDILLWNSMEYVGAFCEIIGNIHDNPLKG